MESPRGFNDPSLGAFAEVASEADMVVLLGKTLDFSLGFGRAPGLSESCSFMQIDPDEEIIERSRRLLGQRLAAAYQTDAAASVAALRAAAARATPQSRSGWLDGVAAAVSFRPPEWTTPRGEESEGLHPVEACQAVQALLDGGTNGILVSDGGEFGQWAQACVAAPRRDINGPAGGICRHSSRNRRPPGSPPAMTARRRPSAATAKPCNTSPN